MKLVALKAHYNTIKEIINTSIQDVIENFEPRVRLAGVRALPNLDRNEYEVSIEFYVVNAPTELINLTLPLERLR